MHSLIMKAKMCQYVKWDFSGAQEYWPDALHDATMTHMGDRMGSNPGLLGPKPSPLSHVIV